MFQKPRWSISFLLTTLFLAACSSSPPPPLVTGKFITPPPPTQNVGLLPINMIASPDGRYVITTDVGYFPALWSIRTSDGQGVSHLDFSNVLPRPRFRSRKPATGHGDTSTIPGSPKSNGLYYGVAISSDGTLYAAQGNHDSVVVLHLSSHGILTRKGIIQTPGIFAAGLALDDRGHLFVVNNASGPDHPFKNPGGVFIFSTATGKKIGGYSFWQSHGGTSNFPLGIAVFRDGSRAYVASERDDCVYALDTSDPAHPTLLASISTGAHPAAVLLSRDRSTLFVANTLSDTISVVDTQTNSVTATILLRPASVRNLPGVTPVALALSPDGKTLYAALADMNAIAVIDPAQKILTGYIPAGWYPSALAVTSDGKRLIIANGKGTTIRKPNNFADPYDHFRTNAYILDILEGNVSIVTLPTTADDLEKLSDQVLANNRLNQITRLEANPLAGIDLYAGGIKHVIYIIKENRTYDQILGDEPQGNGDPSLVLFGRSITPNQHALAERFVLLDNLYACGEVSGDGWAWSTQGMADAYVARNIPYYYSFRGRTYDFEGQNNGLPSGGFPARDVNGKPLSTQPAFKNGLPPIPDVASTGRYLWTVARQAGISIRNYGFLCSNSEAGIGAPGAPDNYPDQRDLQPGGHNLAGITDVDYRRFDLDYADSNAPADYFARTHNRNFLYAKPTFGVRRMPSRFAEWDREFQMMLARDPTGNSVPTLMMIRLPNDHTAGAKPGVHTPTAMVADNDYAVGEVVQAVSHSPIWKSTAIFVIEDDAQSGIDHVDAHRTTGYVISPWIRQNSVDHHFYNTDSMLKTIELLLGLPPLTQYDAIADPITDWDTAPNNSAPYTAIAPAMSIMSQINPPESRLRPGGERMKMAVESDHMDFTHADAAPAGLLDEITWQTVKGPQSHIPARVRSPLFGGDDDQ